MSVRQLPQPDPRGPLALTGLDAATQRAEDATAAADFERASTWWRPARFVRPATDTERALLTELGYDVPEGPVETHVDFPASGVRHRSWPALTDKEM